MYSKKRMPAASGKFYPQDSSELSAKIKGYFPEGFHAGEKLIRCSGAIVPHAGYVFCAQTAAKAYEKIFKNGTVDTVVIIGPNHSGLGESISVYPQGSWVTPLGEVEVNSTLASDILSKLSRNGDYLAHIYEHSLEVQLPFIQYLTGNNFKILPICMKDQSIEAASALSGILKEYKHDGVLFIASTDLNHYESQEVTLKKDAMVMDAVIKMDMQELYSSLKHYDISMCGYGPVAVLMGLEFEKSVLTGHNTSGDVLDEYTSVVGYLSAVLT